MVRLSTVYYTKTTTKQFNYINGGRIILQAAIGDSDIYLG
jgi:hypothetical protein